MDDPFLLWSVRLALVGLASAWAALLLGRPRLGRTLSSLAWGLMAIHFVLAFQLVHDWSHSSAAAATAADTKATTGSDFQYGVWLNYLFLGLWLIELIWSWVGKRPLWCFWVVHGFLLFIAVNATIVFETGPVRWTAVAALLGLAGLALTRLRAARA